MPRNIASSRRTKALGLWLLIIVANVPVAGLSTISTETATLTPASTTPVATEPLTLECPEGWNEFNEHCYNLTVEPKLSWPDAREECQKNPGGDLLVLNSTQERDFIGSIVGFGSFPGAVSAHLWIGLHRSSCAGRQQNFTWIDGAELTNELKNWEVGQPDNFFSCSLFNCPMANQDDKNKTDNECCVDLLAGDRKESGIYRDFQCTTLQGYICEIPKDPPQEDPEPSPSPTPLPTTPVETTTMMPSTTQMFTTLVLYMTTPVEVYSTAVASTSRSDIAPSSPDPEVTSGLSVGASFPPFSSDVISQSSSDASLKTVDISPSLSVESSVISSHTPSPSFTSYDSRITPSHHRISQSNVVFLDISPSPLATIHSSTTFQQFRSTSQTVSSSVSLQPSSAETQIPPSFANISPSPSIPFETTTQAQTTKTLSADTTTNHGDVPKATESTSAVTSDQSQRAGHSTALATTPLPEMCRAEIVDGLQWMETPESTAAQQPCPKNPFAIVTRRCALRSETSAVWRQPDYSDCQVPTTGELLDRVTFMSHFSTVEPSDVTKAAFQLSQMLAPATADDQTARTNSAEEYPELVELLEMLAAMPSKFTECRQADMENFANSFLQAVDNFLHKDNVNIWTANGEVSSYTVRIMDAVESFTAQTASEECDLSLTSHEVTPAFFEGKYDNIVFRKSRETAASFGGLTYTASSPSATITLPPEVFGGVTDEQGVTLLIVVYPTVGQLLDSVPSPPVTPSPGTTKKVMSSIVTSSAVHQPGNAFQKLLVPLCINFTKTVPTFQNEESCVYLGRTESGEPQWLTDGCWVNEKKNESVHCCCNHMTSFAVLGSAATVEPYQLLLLTYVLCSASCFVILLSALILFSVRHLNAASLTVYTSLALSIILSFVVVMAGLERTSNQVVCRILAIATHYLLTTQFVWSLEGALQVCYMANSEREEQRVFQLWIYHVIGWCVPVLPVGICMALWLDGYGGVERCWFSNNVMIGLVTSIGLPVLVNVLVLVYISGKNVPTGTIMPNGVKDNQTGRQRAMDGLRSNLVMLTLLSLCWGVGIAAFQLQDNVLQQAFAVLALLLGVCFFMMYLVMSHDVRRAILHGRKKSRRRDHNRMKLRQKKSNDSLMTSSLSPEPRMSPEEPGNLLADREHANRNEQSLSSISTALSQQNTQSVATNCTDLAWDPTHEEAYGPHRRGDGGYTEPAMDSRSFGFDPRMLPWSNLGMIKAGPGSFGNRSPQVARRGERSPSPARRDRTDLSPVKRTGNIILNHKIIKDGEEARSTEEESQDKKRRTKHRIPSVSGGSYRSADIACMPFPVDLREYRGSRVHPMPLNEVSYSLDYGQGLDHPQYVHPTMANFLAHSHRALGPPRAPSQGQGRIQELPPLGMELAGFHRNAGYYGNERQSLRDSVYDRWLNTRDSARMSFEGQSSREPIGSHHRNHTIDANESTPGPSGYNSNHRRSKSADFHENGDKHSDTDAYRSDSIERGSGSKKGGHRSSRRSRSQGGKKHKQKSARRFKEV